MEDSLILDGVKYVSSKQAAHITGYAKDYIGQMCRAGKIDAKLVGRNWYVSERSLLKHRENNRGERSPSNKEDAKKNEEILSHMGVSYKREIPLYHVEVDERPLYPELQKGVRTEMQSDKMGEATPIKIIRKENIDTVPKSMDIRPYSTSGKVQPRDQKTLQKNVQVNQSKQDPKSKEKDTGNSRVIRVAFAGIAILAILATSFLLEKEVTYVQGEETTEENWYQVTISASVVNVLNNFGTSFKGE